jgi:hypothetical protein
LSQKLAKFSVEQTDDRVTIQKQCMQFIKFITFTLCISITDDYGHYVAYLCYFFPTFRLNNEINITSRSLSLVYEKYIQNDDIASICNGRVGRIRGLKHLWSFYIDVLTYFAGVFHILILFFW